MTALPETPNQTKQCTRCGEVKPLSSFYTYGPLGRSRSDCKACDNKRHRVYASERKGSGAARAAYLKRKYGLTLLDYENLLIKQGNVCAICHRVPRKRRLAVDHCHKTGKIRGLLCDKCNHRLLPAGHDNPQVFRRAAAYLEGVL